MLTVVLAVGCAGGSGPAAFPAPAGTSALVYVRRIAPFPVLAGDGRPDANAFLGGLNVPRPQLLDVDLDGDLDLFLQERSGGIMFFENVGTRSAPELVWRTDRFGDLQVGEWYRFADLDGDGDQDLLAEEPFSYIRYYRNAGRPGAPRFVLAADTVRAADGAPLFSDRQNIPNVTDLDCNGRLDLFIGRLTGNVSRYETTGTDAQGVPRFVLLTDRFEDIEIVRQFGSRHGANTLTFADIDRDGDQDLFWGDFFEPGLLLIENTGPDCASPILRGEPVPFPVANPIATSGYNAPSFGDVDGDGDLDLLVGVIGGAYNPNRTAADNLYYFEQLPDGAFALRTTRFAGGVDIGSESYPSFADLDGDGDLDLVLSNKIEPTQTRTSRMHYFRNVGTTRSPAFRVVDTLPLAGTYHLAPAFADLDGDGDLDLLIGSWKADVAFYRNDGGVAAPHFVLVDSALVRITRGSNTAPALADVDADGDLDLFVGEASGAVNFYRNDGTAAAPAFVLVSDEYLGIDVGRRSVPVPVDLDGDGDLDLVLGREAGGLVLYRNRGTPAEPRFELDEAFTLPLFGLSVPAFVDLDGDGDLDVVAGGVGGGLLYFERQGGR